MAKTKGAMAPAEQSPAMLERIIEGLFPRHEPSPWPPAADPFHVQQTSVPGQSENMGDGGVEAEEEARVTNEELIEIAKSLKAGKAPGPDRIPNMALKRL